MDTNELMLSNNTCLKNGIIRPECPISCSEEKELYKILSKTNLDPKNLAIQWNALILDAIVHKEIVRM
jgi:hypothetical protein